MTIERRPDAESAEATGHVEKGHLVGSPTIAAEWSQLEGEELPHPNTLAGNPHGRPASWIVVGTAFVAFALGGIALILHAWVLMWICAAVAVLMFPIGLAIHIMDDTVGWAQPTPGEVTRGDMTRVALQFRNEELRRLKEAEERGGSHAGE